VRAFITGITGFAGSHLYEHLIDCGDKVLGCSRQGAWRAGFSPENAEDATILEWDVSLAMPEPVKQVVAEFRPDCIYHLAAMSVPADCGRGEPTAEATAANVEGTRAIVDLALSLNPRPRVLLISSSYVYSNVTPETATVHEDAATEPAGGYGKSKLAAEDVLLEAARGSRIEGIVARVFQHTGPRQSPRMIVPEWARQFVRGVEPIEVGSLNTYLDLTDVRDVVRAYRRLIYVGESSGVYNVGSGVCLQSRSIFEKLCAASDSNRHAKEVAPGHRQHPIADISKIVKHTGWKPSIDLDQTLTDTLAFWQNQKTS